MGSGGGGGGLLLIKITENNESAITYGVNEKRNFFY
jgi:hypothetical protein